jgi:SAM-dependent methyltransferase
LFRDYWDHFYADPHPELAGPSPFAEFCLQHLPAQSSVFELGCGNGRDALYFAEHGMAVTACDQSATAIERLIGAASRDRAAWVVRPTFVQSRFEDLSDNGPWDAVYSRFTLHAVNQEAGSQMLRWAHRNLRPGGNLFVEARTVNGSLFGVGEPAGRDAFIHDGHYRRFVRAEEIAAELSAIGFEIRSLVEGAGMARFGADDPVVVRAVAARRARG